MQLKENSKVFICAPENTVTGGPTLCHQLCSCLLAHGVDAYMTYYSRGEKQRDPVANAYKKYLLPYTDEVEDDPDNVLIIPEVRPGFYQETRKIRQVMWWMSVDNYLARVADHVHNLVWGNLAVQVPLKLVLGVLTRENNEKMNLEHWVQSQYAFDFLTCNGVLGEKISFVSDYLEPVYVNRIAEGYDNYREDIVLYNPQKGARFTKLLMEQAPDIHWVPIEKMTAVQVRDLLQRSKVYIDFGNHPGKDRIPREAAACGCCIITGKRGAAANDIDIAIPAAYKFADTEENIPAILAMIRKLLQNYSQHCDDYVSYRQKIKAEPSVFLAEVEQAFELSAPQQVLGAAWWGDIAMGRALKDVFCPQSYRHFYICDRDMDENEFYRCEDGMEYLSEQESLFLYQEKRVHKFVTAANDKESIERLQQGGVKRADILVADITSC